MGILRRRTLTVLLGVLSDEEEHEVCAGYTVTLATAEMLWCWSLRDNHALVMNWGQNYALLHQ